MEQPLLRPPAPPPNSTFEAAKLLASVMAFLLCVVAAVMLSLVWLSTAAVVLTLISGQPVGLFHIAESYRVFAIVTLFIEFRKERTCAGLSLKSVELTALSLGIRAYCDVFLGNDDEVCYELLVDGALLVAMLWIIHMIRYELRSSYLESKDNFPICCLVLPCLLLSVAIPLSSEHFILHRIMWAFYVYLKAVAPIPQLWTIHNTKIVELYKKYYFLTLGTIPFITITNCVIQFLFSKGVGNNLWPNMVVASQTFQAFTLACFFYCYIQCFRGAR